MENRWEGRETQKQKQVTLLTWINRANQPRQLTRKTKKAHEKQEERRIWLGAAKRLPQKMPQSMRCNYDIRTHINTHKHTYTQTLTLTPASNIHAHAPPVTERNEEK
ncbi:hypothetical protein, unlikely [Trypanosoma brucei gambiense DAL972]|uniref:Uncharacterized protein n=1 Tax=Trypanosoma brucei gambiense (strain MHOM/CI/86/DAL972) TaxID=679716 RepID=D0A3X1_TRYB9|nr:hypothetical protein, unlikely [Trypanosoma brucei gambiense DAL972]CBH15965.1 hypothetical protein, unlikely [Trypanosoma brucei gambiense DAL972]|eukprot:XP_011778229.1 hypothetical protein, unlikely [Trypanosoma brucei gambiense DAL972]